ncbi:MAG: hypothetical protein GF353_21750, partial [Candidatus Lokiarchaeota archaeon]|nr:hypothetical protein [Candidatus Lokiarchaeota archaeon]
MKHFFVRIFMIILFVVLFVRINSTNSQINYYAKSYALVIGISKYPSANWDNLKYPEKDARGMADLLRSQGFEVITLYNQQATREAIISKMQDYIARKVKRNDRVVIFFSGHGYTENYGNEDYGYIVPYDAKTKSATYISMSDLRD